MNVKTGEDTANKKWYMSSANAEKLSATVKGFFGVGVITAIATILKMFGLDIDMTDIQSLVNSVAGVIAAIGILGSSFVTVFGVLRKIYNKVKK
jgi:hypothetical protein